MLMQDLAFFLSSDMALGQITRTFLAPKHAISIQPVRTWRTRYGNVHSLTVKYEVKPVVDPPAGVERYVYNRNPRNLERLAIAHRNAGWSLDKPNRTYYHK